MRSAVCAVAILSTALAVGCFRFTEEKMRSVTDDAGADTLVEDVGTDAPPSVCERNGGKATFDTAMGELVTKLKTDCRVDRYFLSMAPDRLQHMQECMSAQLAWITRCPGAAYPAKDSKGAECRDIQTTHKGLGIHTEDYDAMLDDILAVLTAAKVQPQDLAKIIEVLKIQRTDVVNPGDAGRGDACIIDTGVATDAGADTDDY